MANPIKYSEIADINIQKNIELLTQSLIDLGKAKDNVAKSKPIQVFQTGTGQEIKQTNDAIDETRKNVSKLNDVEKEILRTEKARNEELQKQKLRTQEARKETKFLASQQLKLTGEYEKQSKQLNDNIKKYRELVLTNKKNTKEARNLRREITKQDASLKKLDKSVGRSQRNVGNYGSALKGAGRNVKGLALQFVGLYAVLRGLGAFVRTFRDFEKAQSRLAAVAGKTTDEIKALTNQAKQLGGITAFTASQVTSLQIELAKLGFSEGGILDSTKGILDLAAATGTELADSASIAGSVLRAFALDTKEMNRVVDVLAKSTATSALDMEKLKVSLAVVSPVARNAGVTLEETVATLGKLVDRGVDASTAGTGLRNIFLELSKQGLTLNQAMSKIQNATDKNAVALELFGKRGATVAAIMAETTDATAELTKTLEGAQGTAQEMADEQLDNLAGSITKAKSAWEGFVLGIEDGEGTISTSIRGIVDAFTILFQELQKFAKGQAQVNRELREQQAKTNFDLLAEANDFISKRIKLEEESLKFFRKSYEDGTLAQQEWVRDNFDTTLSEAELYKQVVARINQNIEVIQNDANRRRLSAISKQLSEYQSELTNLEKEGGESFLKIVEDFEKTGDKASRAVVVGAERYLQLQANIKQLKEEYKGLTDTQEENTIITEEGSEKTKTATGLIGLLTEQIKTLNKEKLEALSIEEIQRINSLLEQTNAQLKNIQAGLEAPDGQVELIPIDTEAQLEKLEEDKEKLIEGTLRARNEIVDLLGTGFQATGEEGNPFLESIGITPENEEIVKQQFTNFINNTRAFLSQLAQIRLDAANEEFQLREANVKDLEDKIAEREGLRKEDSELSLSELKNRLAAEQEALNKATEEQEKTQKAQQRIDDLQQVSSIATAAANLIKGWSAVPFGLGQALGAASVAAMIAGFIASKVSANQAVRAEHGLSYVIGGKRHSEGGTPIPGNVEAEKGEVHSVFSRKITGNIGANKLMALSNKINAGEIKGDSIDMLLTGVGSGVLVNNIERRDNTANIAQEILTYLKSRPYSEGEGIMVYPDQNKRIKEI